MNNETTYIGRPMNRVDGYAKVTGDAKYAADYHAKGLCYGVVVSAGIARGRIVDIDTSAALQLEGVLQVFTHQNVSGLAWFNRSYKDMDAPPGKHFRYLQTDMVAYSQQPVALVVAETFELARYAATLVNISYEADAHTTSLTGNLDKARPPKGKKTGFKKPANRGHFDKAFKEAPVRAEATYYQGAEHHNPMEMHATTVLYYKNGSITVYDKTQGVLNTQSYVKSVFGLSGKKVKALSPFVGGAFGSGLRPQYQLFMAVLAALELKRSVKVMLTRQQMFSLGFRPITQQTLSIGAVEDGSLQAISHQAVSGTSQFEDYVENIVNWSGMLYHCKNVQQDYKLVSLDTYTPLDMRAPGAVTGVFGLECAMDELAYKLNMDPLELRRINYSVEDGSMKKPYSSKGLMDCYEQAAARFGWSQRNPAPRSMKTGRLLTGWGMATGMWDAMTVPARAKATFTADGKLTVGSATADIGTGTYTIMTQIAAETLGLPIDNVTFQLGDASLPFAYLEGGSATAASVGTAVQKACLQIRERLLSLAKDIPDSPFRELSIEQLTFADGKMYMIETPANFIHLKDIMTLTETDAVNVTSTPLPNIFKQMKYAKNTHSAVFVEVQVDEELGLVKVSRVVSAIAAGRILNPKTARSQIMGGIVWGISGALYEESVMDHQFGRFVNHNYAEYHIPVNLDINDIEVIFVEENDDVVNPLGVKGVGEIGQVGVAAAVANAIFHATGKRIRDLPVTLDKLL
ncbi:xanthine dehydrogenase family protein molybdopterin-binding subunit [Chitinophaga pinensis]|uniref:Aldehyde oxidase and xanthine dehydrogenase molybdopterin binding n=1 Tax=Chitinophaga pinensis (strain ATCC 43595 / DSM 2588 / LMG 13176 / NBRC 15968 / NCIMB 11800 / UQM 2034) TaxID=485918 RepID=A0A979G2K6_CHIPD|nr:xanthine dehydrogenase family protein molybdopterin-binding subunit [Chitinophaga pinensis]ACU59651.1 aldehyde oxidase and xanthine dehydrogenase molybdopterin binding [Chitinophaga pinensis DSM 2588]